MSRLIVAFVMVAALLPFSHAQDARKKKESEREVLKKLQGVWNMSKMEVEGRSRGNTDQLGVLFDGDTYYFLFNGEKRPNSAKVFLDTTKDPITIDLVLRGVGVAGTQLGILRFTDEGLEICLNQPRGRNSDKRPSVFTTKAQVGAGSILYVLEREERATEKDQPKKDARTTAKSSGSGSKSKREAIRVDLKKLQGNWQMKKMEVEGRPFADEDRKQILIDVDNYYFVQDGVKRAGPFKIFMDPTKEPKTIDLISGYGTQLGIYRFTEDGLEICLNQARGRNSDKRPSEFTTKAKVGAGSILYVLEQDERAKEKGQRKGSKSTAKSSSAGGKSKKEAIKADLKKLEGNWQMKKMDVEGRAFGDTDRRADSDRWGELLLRAGWRKTGWPVQDLPGPNQGTQDDRFDRRVRHTTGYLPLHRGWPGDLPEPATWPKLGQAPVRVYDQGQSRCRQYPVRPGTTGKVSASS